MSTTQELLNVSNIRKDFPIMDITINGFPLVYLDNAASSQKPLIVINSIKEFYERYYSNVHRGVYTLSSESTIAYENARKIIAQFINANYQEVIFTRGSTEAINLLAYSLSQEFKPGDEIIVSIAEHHSNFVPWQQIAKLKGLKFTVIAVNDNYKIELADLKSKITDKTKIVSLFHVSNVLGTINPIKELAEFCRSKNIIFVVDAAQSVSRMKIDVKNLGCDFLVFSGHKMYGPTGIGVLYGRKALLEKILPFNYGGDMIKQVDLQETIFNDLPWKFEAGTPNIAGAIGLAEAVKYLQSIGLDNIEEYEQSLAKKTYEHLSKVKGIKLLNKPELAILSFNFYNLHPHDVSAVLDQKGIAIRGGHHCAMPLMKHLGINSCNRISFGIYNSEDDMHKLINGLETVRELFGK